MARLTFVPLRSIAAGYTQGVPVDLDIGLEDYDRDAAPIKTENVSISGTRETIADRLEYRYSVRTVAIPHAERAFWRMFADSIAFGEEFTFDPEGSLASPSSEVAAVKLDGKIDEKFSEGRFVRYSWRMVRV